MLVDDFNFKDEKVKEKIAVLCQKNNNLIAALSTIVNLYPECIIKDIKVASSEYLITVISDTSEKEFVVNKNGIISNIYYIEQSEEKFMNNHCKILSKKQMSDFYEYEYVDDTKELDYRISIMPLKKIVVGNIIAELLDENHCIRDIKDIYYAIEKCINILDISLKIQSLDEESFLEIVEGKVKRYQSTTKDGNRIIREYLSTDGKYYVDETISREVNNEYHPFVKTKVR